MIKLILFIILILYIGWINTSIREIKQKLSNIEDLLKKQS
jgi:hypothetical protein